MSMYWDDGPLIVPSIVVIELEDDEETVITQLLDHNGNRLMVTTPSTKQGFIGFISPKRFEEIEEYQIFERKAEMLLQAMGHHKEVRKLKLKRLKQAKKGTKKVKKRK